MRDSILHSETIKEDNSMDAGSNGGGASNRIETMLNKRKGEHEHVINTMRINMQKTNEKIECDMRKGAENLKDYIQRAKIQVMKSFQVLAEKNIVCADKKVVANIMRVIVSLNEARKQQIDEYAMFLVKLEKQRSQEFKRIFRVTYKKVLDIACMLPFELQEYFRNELLYINQITLNNFHYYYQVQRNLKLELENDVFAWSQELKTMHRKKETVPPPIDNIKFVDKSIQPSPSSLFQNVWLVDIQNKLAFLDRNAKIIVELYKIAIINVFNRQMQEQQNIISIILEEIKENVDKRHANDIHNEIFYPVVDLSHFTGDDLIELKTKWNEVLQNVQNGTHVTCNFLRIACGLWINHFKRIATVKSLLLKDLRNIIRRNNEIIDEDKMKLSVALDKLRQEATEKTTKKAHENVVKILDTTVQTLKNHCDIECKVIEKYRSFAATEMEILALEIQRFLQLNPQNADVDPKRQCKRASRMLEEEKPKEGLVPIQILYCKFQGIAVSNWQFGLWEAIKHYLNTCRLEMMECAEQWISYQKDILHKKCEFQYKICRTKLHITDVSFRAVRLYEVLDHTERLEQHEKGIEEQMTKTTVTLTDTCLQRSNSILEEVNTRIAAAMVVEWQSVRQIVKSLRTVEKHTLVDEQHIRQLYENFSNSCKGVVNNTLASNYFFLKSFRLFSENGNFSRDEIKVLQKMLDLLQATVTKWLTDIQKAAKVKETDAITNKNTISMPLMTKLAHYKEEYQVNDNILRLLNNFKRDLRNEAYNMSCRIQTCRACVRKFKENSTLHIGNFNYMDAFSVSLNNVLSGLTELHDYLHHPNYANKETTKTEVLDAPPHANGGNYIPKCNEFNAHVMEQVQLVVKTFYVGIAPISRRLQPTLQECLEEVTAKLDGFLDQCQNNWMEKVVQFIKFLNDFDDYVKNYCTAFICANLSRTLDEFRANQALKLNDVNRELSDVQAVYIRLHAKLKPMFGHPINVDRLTQLDKEMASVVERTTHNVSDLVATFQTETKEEYKEITDRVEDLKQFFRNFLVDESVHKLKLDVCKQVELAATFHVKNTPHNIEVTQSFCSSLALSKESSSIESHEDFSTSLLSQKHEEAETNKKNDVQILLDHLDGICERSLLSLTAKEAEAVEVHRRFQMMWSADISHIRNLFTVKYDDKKNDRET